MSQGTSAYSLNGVLVPGVRLVEGYDVKVKGRGAAISVPKAAAKSSKATKRKRGVDDSDDSDDSMGGFGPEIQTLAKDIKHLQKLFPGKCFVYSLNFHPHIS